MHRNQEICYDTIIIGAGIAGCSAAFALQQRGQRVLLVDRSAVPASGGSGAAGAFVSPKIGKGSPLQALTNEAYSYAVAFYSRHFPKYFDQSGVARIPKDLNDSEKFAQYEEYNIDKYENIERGFFLQHGIKNAERGFWFEEAGVCDAPQMCRAIWERVMFRQYDVASLVHEEEGWKLISRASEHGGVAQPQLYAKNVVLATGYQNDLLDMRYMGVKGLWGSRGDYASDLHLKISLHKKISISKNINGIIKLGATHIKAKEPCVACDGRPLADLEVQAAEMVDTSDFKLKEIFCGMRAGSKDYFPLVGRVVDVPWILEHYPGILKGAKPPLKHLEGLYVMNGVGGRGFVFAPLMAKWLSELIVEEKAIDSRVSPDRLFLKWCRKL